MKEIIEDFKEVFILWLKISIIGIVVTTLWQWLEILIIGEINPDKVDTIIAIILTFSLYGNIITWFKSRKQKKDV